MFACTDFTMVLVTRMYDALHCNEYYGSLNPTCPTGLSGFLSERTDHETTSFSSLLYLMGGFSHRVSRVCCGSREWLVVDGSSR